MKEIHEIWLDQAEETPDVFSRPVIAPQGQDGVPHFNYYDNKRSLSFQWDGYIDQHVVVSHGGYGEPIKWTFDLLEMWREPVREVAVASKQPHFSQNLNCFFQAVAHFQRACDAWVTKMEMEGFEQEPKGDLGYPFTPPKTAADQDVNEAARISYQQRNRRNSR